MRIAVLGASGGCGQQLVRLAVERGHQVVAVVRSATWQPPDGVPVARGNLADEQFLRGAIRGCDVVVSGLGLRIAGLAPWHRPEDPDFLSRSTRALVAAMKAEGLRRVMAVSAGGAGDSRAKVPGFFRAMISYTALKYAYAEVEAMERILFESGLDAMVCRPSGLTDGPPTGQVSVVQAYRGRATISRADVAAWMLDQLAAPAFPADRSPMITVTGVEPRVAN